MYAAGERRLRHGMQADVVGHVREVGLARGNAGDERKGFGHVEMGIMLRKAERVDDEHLHAPEFFDLGTFDGLEIGQVRQLAEAVARDGEAVGVVPRNGNDLQLPHPERPGDVDLMQLDFGHAAVFILREGIVEVLAHDAEGMGCGVDVDLVHQRRVIDKVESPHVVQPADMIFVFVREEDGVEVADARTEHLAAEIGAGVDDHTHAACLDHGRSAQAVVALVGRGANLAAAPDDRDALRGARSQKGEFHECKCRKISAYRSGAG